MNYGLDPGSGPLLFVNNLKKIKEKLVPVCFIILTGGFFWCFLCPLLNTASSCRPLDTTVSEDAGIEPRTVATLALAVRRSHY